jgi:hypothetical protein
MSMAPRPQQNTSERATWGQPLSGARGYSKERNGTPGKSRGASENSGANPFVVEGIESGPQEAPFIERSGNFWRDEKPLKIRSK